MVAGVPTRPCVLYQLVCYGVASFILWDNSCGKAFRDNIRWHSLLIIALNLIAVDLERLDAFLIVLIRPNLLDLHRKRIVLVATVLLARRLLRGCELRLT